MGMRALGLVAVLTIVPAAWAQTGDGHYAGTVHGASRAYGDLCSEFSMNITIADGVVNGSTRRATQSNGSRTIVVEQKRMTGTVSADGKATVTFFGSSFPADVSTGRFVAQYVGRNCTYDFDLPKQ
jgi:hypothetical protein